MADAAHTLSEAQQRALDDKKIELRSSNERYLRSKPEVRAMTAAFLHEVLESKPENVVLFAQEFFAREDLPEVLKKQSS